MCSKTPVINQGVKCSPSKICMDRPWKLKNNSSYKVGHIPLIDGVITLVNGRFPLGSFTLSHRSCKIVGAHLVPDFLLGVVLSVGFWRQRITKKKWKTFLRFEHPNFNKWRCHIFDTLFHSELGNCHVQLGRSDSNYPRWGNDFQVPSSFSREQLCKVSGSLLRTNTSPLKKRMVRRRSSPFGANGLFFMGYGYVILNFQGVCFVLTETLFCKQLWLANLPSP